MKYAMMACALIAFAFTQTSRADQDAEKIEKFLSNSILNVHSEGDGMFRGARPDSAAAVANLAKAGVKIIVNLQGGDLNTPIIGPFVASQEPGELPENIAAEKVAAEKNGMKFYNFQLNAVQPVNDDEAALIEKALHVMADAVKNKQSLYIHCEHGKDRTGLVVALFSHFYYAIPSDMAHYEMLEYGHGDWLNLIVTSAMDDYYWDAVGHNRFAGLYKK